jgi:serine phosphatase RsbU (regulator of sigma subunit)/anti-sigma regulatory factor (Ser/Thr protein kinase)
MEYMDSIPTLLRNIRDRWSWHSKRDVQVKPRFGANELQYEENSTFEIAPNDPIVAYFMRTSGAVEVDSLQLDSPALKTLKGQGVKLVVPLVSQGELVGLLALGPRLSDQQYSSDDRGLLSTLAIQAAPALRVAQMIREQQGAIRERERLNQELHVARSIQRTLLPKDLPVFPGWKLAEYYKPAREVGGDFYDFLSFADGRLGIIIGDVTDKGIPAALVMASTRSMLRSVAQGQGEGSPGAVLERVNNLLYQDIPPRMFVTCLYAILDTASGRLIYANAGHDLPYLSHNGHASELLATGMPLGLMPDMSYEEKEATLVPGDSILFYSDGLVEAHDPKRAMFGFPRLMTLLEEHPDNTPVIDYLLSKLDEFTGPGWEQEDDVTMVSLQRVETYEIRETTTRPTTQMDTIHMFEEETNTQYNAWLTLDEWTIPSEPGNERLAMQRVVQAVQPLHLSQERLEQLKTAVAEATMNAMEHGNHYLPEKPVAITVQASNEALLVRIVDHGGTRLLPGDTVEPDIEAKLAGLQSPRGWGLFLIKNMVDDMHIFEDATHHTVELIMNL